MAAVYLGSFTVGGAIPGASAVLDQLGIALDAFRATVSEELPKFLDAENAIQAQADAINVARIAIRVPAVADFEAQATAAAGVSADLGLQLSDPGAYISGLLDGLAQVETSIHALTPSVELNDQISAAATLEAEFNAKVDAVDVELDALVNIRAALGVQLAALAAIRAAVQVALDATDAAASAYVAIGDWLETAGAHCFLYTGPLSGLGAAIDAVSGSAGIGAGVDVRVPVVLVDATDAGKVSAVNAVFRVS